MDSSLVEVHRHVLVELLSELTVDVQVRWVVHREELLGILLVELLRVAAGHVEVPHLGYEWR